MDFEKVEMLIVISILYKSFVNLDELRCFTSGLTESVLMKKSQCDPSLAPTPGLLDSWTFMEIDRFRLPFSATGLGVFSLTIFAKETIGVVLMLIPASTFNKISNFHTSSRFFTYSKNWLLQIGQFFLQT